jgi:hypothetical protein
VWKLHQILVYKIDETEEQTHDWGNSERDHAKTTPGTFDLFLEVNLPEKKLSCL